MKDKKTTIYDYFKDSDSLYNGIESSQMIKNLSTTSFDTYWDCSSQYSSEYNNTYPYTSNATTTTSSGTGLGGTINNPYYINSNGVSMGTSTMYGIDSTTWSTFTKQNFSKSDFLNEVVISGKSAYSYIDENISTMTSDGIISFLEFAKTVNMMTSEIFWRVIDENSSVYPLFEEYHDLNNCLRIIHKTKNKNLIKFTRESIRESVAFKREVNAMKLKGVFNET